MAYYLRLKKYNNTRLESWDNEPFEYFCATNRFGMFPHNFMSFATSRNPGHMSFLFTNKTIICCENLKRDTLYKCKKKKNDRNRRWACMTSESSPGRLHENYKVGQQHRYIVNDIAKLCWPLQPIPLHRKMNNILSL